MIRFRNILTATFVTVISMQLSQAYAFGLGDVAGAVTGDQKSGVTDTGTLISQGKGLMGKFSLAFGNMTAAEGQTAIALGLKEQGDHLLATSKAYAAGNVEDSDAIARDVQYSEDANKAINAKMAEAGKVDANSQKQLALAVPYYGKGIVASVGLPSEFSNWAKSAQGAISGLRTNPLEATKLTNGVSAPLSVATKLPDLITSFSQTSKNFVLRQRKQR